ncbi:MAG: EAL and HDOD domain-containing protein [Burkholderiales bacterium]
MANSPDFYLGRQPILDRQRNQVAFELLFRSGPTSSQGMVSALQGSAAVIIQAFTDLGIGAALGQLQGYINIDRELLMSDTLELLPKHQVVLELLENMEIDAALVKRCEQLKSKGYSLALDDLIAIDDACTQLMQFVKVVKVDVMQVPPARLPDLVTGLRRWPVELLAEKVETAQHAQELLDLGFDLFQGYYFARPAVLSGKRSNPSQLAVMRLLEMAMREAPIREIEEVFKGSPDLIYRLLQLVNSVACGLTRRIGSLPHAVTVLGLRQLQRWLMLLLFAMERGVAAGSSPLLLLAAQRGSLMESVARQTRPRDREFHDRAFMTGILSLLDGLLGVTVAEIIAALHLSEDVAQALADRAGEIGQLLSLAERLEHDAFDDLGDMVEGMEALDFNELPRFQVRAVQWANDLTQLAT